MLQISSAFIQKSRWFLNFTCLHYIDVIWCAHILSHNERNYIPSKAMISIVFMNNLRVFQNFSGFYNLQNLHLSSFIKKCLWFSFLFLKNMMHGKNQTRKIQFHCLRRELFFTLSLSTESKRRRSMIGGGEGLLRNFIWNIWRRTCCPSKYSIVFLIKAPCIHWIIPIKFLFPFG